MSSAVIKGIRELLDEAKRLGVDNLPKAKKDALNKASKDGTLQQAVDEGIKESDKADVLLRRGGSEPAGDEAFEETTQAGRPKSDRPSIPLSDPLKRQSILADTEEIKQRFGGGKKKAGAKLSFGEVDNPLGLVDSKLKAPESKEFIADINKDKPEFRGPLWEKMQGKDVPPPKLKQLPKVRDSVFPIKQINEPSTIESLITTIQDAAKRGVKEYSGPLKGKRQDPNVIDAEIVGEKKLLPGGQRVTAKDDNMSRLNPALPSSGRVQGLAGKPPNFSPKSQSTFKTPGADSLYPKKPEAPKAEVPKTSNKKKVAGAVALGGAGAGLYYAAQDGQDAELKKDLPAEEVKKLEVDSATLESADPMVRATVKGAARIKSPEDAAALGRQVTSNLSPQEKTLIRGPLDALNDKLAGIQAEYKNARKQAKSEAEQKELQTRWLQVAETVGQAFTQIGASLHGLKTGKDLSGLKFNRTNWAEEFNRIDNRLDADIKQLNLEESALRGEIKDEKGQIVRGQERAEDKQFQVDQDLTKSERDMLKERMQQAFQASQGKIGRDFQRENLRMQLQNQKDIAAMGTERDKAKAESKTQIKMLETKAEQENAFAEARIILDGLSDGTIKEKDAPKEMMKVRMKLIQSGRTPDQIKGIMNQKAAWYKPWKEIEALSPEEIIKNLETGTVSSPSGLDESKLSEEDKKWRKWAQDPANADSEKAKRILAAQEKLMKGGR